jgi:hypothetical protein
MATFSKIAQALSLTGVTGSTNDMVSNWLKGLGGSGTTPDMLFTYLRSTGLTGSLSDMLSAYVFSSGKVLIDLSETASSFYSLGADWVAAGDYSVEVDFVTTNTGDTKLIGGDDNKFILRLGNDGTLAVLIGDGSSYGFTLFSGNLNAQDGRLHTAKALINSSGMELFLDGASVASNNSVVNINTVINKLGAFGTTASNQFFDGIISNVKLTDIDTLANSLEFKLNKLTANIEYPVGNVFGSELASTITTDAGSSFIDGVLTLVQDAGDDFAETGLPVTNGEPYLLEYEVTSETLTGNSNLFFADSASGNFQSLDASVGIHSVAILPTFTSNVRLIIRNEADGNQVVMQKISIKSVTNALTYQNIGTGRSFRETYTLIDDDYFGPQAVVNSDFATDSDWSKGTNITISGEQGVFASAPNNQGIVQNGVADEGRIFDVTVTVSGYVEGGLQLRNPFEDFTPATANGVFTFTGIVDNNSVFLRADGVTTLNIDSVTSRRRIEVAS